MTNGGPDFILAQPVAPLPQADIVNFDGMFTGVQRFCLYLAGTIVADDDPMRIISIHMPPSLCGQKIRPVDQYIRPRNCIGLK